MKKNVFLELLRFLAATIIVGYHTKFVFHSGWIFVEFFFIISGFFAYKKVLQYKESGESFKDFPVKYTLKKMWRIFPYTFMSMILFVVFELREQLLNAGIKTIGRFALYFTENISLLNATGMIPKEVELGDGWVMSTMMMPILWYIIVLFVMLPVMMYLVYYLDEKIGLWLYIFLPMFLYGALIMSTGTIDGFHYEMMIYPALCMRALAGLLLGALVYRVSVAFQNKISKKRYFVVVFGLIEILVYVFVACLASIENLRNEIIVIACLVLGLGLTLSGATFTSYVKGKVISFMGALSLPMYCVHMIVVETKPEFSPYMVYLITICISIVMWCIVQGITFVSKKIKSNKEESK